MPIVPVASITVGDRCRKDLGDLTDLQRSIREVGLLHPPVVTPGLQLVAGERRLSAVRALGWTEVPVTIAETLTDALAAMKAERDENTCRKTLTVTEDVASQDRIREAYERAAAARARKRTDLMPPDCAETFRAVAGETRDQVAQAVGSPRSGRSADKARAVIKAAEAEPEKFAPLVAEMDRTGKVDRAYKAVKAAETQARAQEIAQTTPLPDLVKIVTGDFREAMKQLEDNSVALIFTDPPYDEGSIPLYAEMAREAERVLVEGGSLLAYAGHYAVGEIIAGMSQHLRYWWLCGVKHSGPSARLIGKYVFVEWKPILWFVKGHRRNLEWVADMVARSEAPSKAEHEWQQSEVEAAYYIDKLTQPGELVVDPFLGSGTTLLAAAKAGRAGWGCEMDADRADVARGRVAEALS